MWERTGAPSGKDVAGLRQSPFWAEPGYLPSGFTLQPTSIEYGEYGVSVAFGDGVDKYVFIRRGLQMRDPIVAGFPDPATGGRQQRIIQGVPAVVVWNDSILSTGPRRGIDVRFVKGYIETSVSSLGGLDIEELVRIAESLR